MEKGIPNCSIQTNGECEGAAGRGGTRPYKASTAGRQGGKGWTGVERDVRRYLLAARGDVLALLLKQGWVHAHTYFSHHCQSKEIADEAHHGYKDLSAVAFPQDGWVEIHNGGDLSFHFHKLCGRGEKKKTAWMKSPWRGKEPHTRFCGLVWFFFVCMRIVFCPSEAAIMRMRAAFVGQ